MPLGLPSILPTQKKLKITLEKINNKLKETKEKQNSNSLHGTAGAIESTPWEF